MEASERVGVGLESPEKRVGPAARVGVTPVMNRRLRGCAALVLLMGIWGLAAQAQPAGGAAAGKAWAPEPIPEAGYSDPATNRKKIEELAGQNFTKLLDDSDPAGQTVARDALTKACYTGNTIAPPTFLFEYGNIINRLATARLANKATLRERLNIAIVTARVAAAAQNSTLAPTALLLVNDPAEPVVIWGLKAAQAIVPEAVKIKLAGGPALHPLVAAIAPAVLKHPSGPVFEEAYNALGSVAEKDVPPAARAAVLGELVSLWDNRLQQYRKDIPEDPAVDGRAVYFMTLAETWKTVVAAPKMQLQIMQMISDQISMAAQYADGLPVVPEKREQRDQLVKLAAQCAGGCYVVGTHQNKEKLVAVSMRPSKLSVLTNQKIRPEIDPVVQQIAADFPGVNPPPVVGNAGAGVAQP